MADSLSLQGVSSASPLSSSSVVKEGWLFKRGMFHDFILFLDITGTPRHFVIGFQDV